jgi:hypothetical protein
LELDAAPSGKAASRPIRGSATISAAHEPAGATKCPLVLGLLPGPRLAGYVEYAVDLLDAATIERWAGMYIDLLDLACRRPEQPLVELIAPPAHG